MKKMRFVCYEKRCGGRRCEFTIIKSDYNTPVQPHNCPFSIQSADWRLVENE